MNELGGSKARSENVQSANSEKHRFQIFILHMPNKSH